MVQFFQLQNLPVLDLLSDPQKELKQYEYRSCTKCGRKRGHLKNDSRNFYLRHNDRNQQIIWGSKLAMHINVIEKIEREGFTGFRTQPAKVTFLDGEISDEYREFTVTGWAGVVRAESGMRLLDSCPVCLWKNYGPITNFDQVIDWNQWTGEDFFFVWPLIGHRLCTERVAKWLENSGIRSFSLGRGFELLEKRKDRLNFGIPRGPLSDYLPEDFAIKYGRPLGLE